MSGGLACQGAPGLRKRFRTGARMKRMTMVWEGRTKVWMDRWRLLTILCPSTRGPESSLDANPERVRCRVSVPFPPPSRKLASGWMPSCTIYAFPLRLSFQSPRPSLQLHISASAPLRSHLTWKVGGSLSLARTPPVNPRSQLGAERGTAEAAPILEDRRA